MQIGSFFVSGGYTKLVLSYFLSPTVGSNNVAETIVVSGVRLAMLRKCDSHGGLYNAYISSVGNAARACTKHSSTLNTYSVSIGNILENYN